MLFFLDTADVKELREGVAMGLVDGVTTNPSLIAKTGRSFKEVIHEIVDIVDGPISAECVSLTFEEMMAEARPIAKIHKNIVIKLPCTFEGLKATRQLKKEGVPVNMTLCFSPNQALLAAKAGAAYISPFVGRLDDISITGMDLIKEIKTIYTQCGFTQTKILVASIRHPLHVKEAGMLGADVSTMPFSTLKQLIQHPLTDLGIKRFLEDWAKVPKA